jgi:hypothetical protein
MKKVFLLLALVALIGCRSNKPVTSTTTKVIVSERQIDTVLFTRPDSASIVALIRCDSLGNAYLSEIQKLQSGKAVKPSLSVKDNKAFFDCKVDSMAVFLKLYRKYESVSDTSSTVVTIYKDREKGFLEKAIDTTLLLLGGISVGALLFVFLFRKKWA